MSLPPMAAGGAVEGAAGRVAAASAAPTADAVPAAGASACDAFGVLRASLPSKVGAFHSSSRTASGVSERSVLHLGSIDAHRAICTKLEHTFSTCVA
jgi:hypothetical protein